MLTLAEAILATLFWTATITLLLKKRTYNQVFKKEGDVTTGACALLASACTAGVLSNVFGWQFGTIFAWCLIGAMVFCGAAIALIEYHRWHHNPPVVSEGEAH
jgi:hypothetical protein